MYKKRKPGTKVPGFLFPLFCNPKTYHHDKDQSPGQHRHKTKEEFKERFVEHSGYSIPYRATLTRTGMGNFTGIRSQNTLEQSAQLNLQQIFHRERTEPGHQTYLAIVQPDCDGNQHLQ